MSAATTHAERGAGEAHAAGAATVGGSTGTSVRQMTRGMSYEDGAAMMMPLQRKGAGKTAGSYEGPAPSAPVQLEDGGGVDPATSVPMETPVLTNNTVASSTYVDKSRMGPNQGGGGGTKKPSYGIWTAFISAVTQIEEAMKGDATQSWGMQIWGMGDGTDSTATKAAPGTEHVGQTFDYAKFSEMIDILMVAAPEGTRPHEILAGFQHLDIRDSEAVSHWCFEVVSEREEIEEAIFGHDEAGAAEHDEKKVPSGGNVGASGSAGTAKVDSTTQQGGGGMVNLKGKGQVPESKIVLFYERQRLMKGAPIDELDVADGDKEILKAHADAVWGRAWMADGNKRYSRDGTWVKPVVVPTVLKSTEPGKFGAHGFDRVAYNWRIANGDVYEPITFSTEPWTDLM